MGEVKVCCLKVLAVISLHHRFTERFSFLKADQVIHVVVDQLGDNEAHRSKAEGSGTDWWVFFLFGHSDVSCFTFAGGLSSSRPRLESRGLKTGQLQRVLDWRTPTSSSAAMQMRFSNSFKASFSPPVISSGSQPIFRAQPGSLSALQRYDDRSALDADGRRNSSFSKRLER